jgi:lauroyl/myristoyl acyltransferase
MSSQWGEPSSRRQAAILFLSAQAARCPRGIADRLLGLAGVAAGAFEPRRVALAHAWAGAHGQRGTERWRTVLAILAHRGHAFADHWAPVFERPDALRRRVRLDGREHLEAVKGRPAILLGFHLGSPLASWGLAAHGHDCVVAVAGGWTFEGRVKPRAGWRWSPDTERVAVISRESGTTDRAIALYRLRGLLLAGRTLRVLGDGRSGRELFRVPTPAGTLIVRSAWWLLRRQTGAVTLPVLAYREGSKAVVAVYPPLPPPTRDPVDDTNQCRVVLAPLVQDFVRRHPEQCLPWVLDPATGPENIPHAVAE